MPYRDCRAQVWIFKLSEHLKPDVVVENVRFASREYLSCLSPVPLVMGSLRRLGLSFPIVPVWFRFHRSDALVSQSVHRGEEN